jgi:hypothetical protein
VKPSVSVCVVKCSKHKATQKGARKSESAVVVMKRVMIVEQRAGGA